MTSVIFRPAADADVAEAFVWYEQQRRGLGEEFRTELRAALGRIVENPKSFQEIYRQTRRVPLRRFPYSLFYREYPGLIVIIACMHGRRNPRRWRSRS